MNKKPNGIRQHIFSNIRFALVKCLVSMGKKRYSCTYLVICFYEYLFCNNRIHYSRGTMTVTKLMPIVCNIRRKNRNFLVAVTEERMELKTFSQWQQRCWHTPLFIERSLHMTVSRSIAQYNRLSSNPIVVNHTL